MEWENKLGYGLMAVCLVMFVGIVLVAMWYVADTESKVAVDEATLQSCGECFGQFNLSFPNPVEAYYYMVVNMHGEPEMIIMKYEMMNHCNEACLIRDVNESRHMARYVYRPPDLNEDPHGRLSSATYYSQYGENGI